ncbi:hypothetical protein [Bacillus sp. JJ722]|uniref:hypothetical protein n=1 Tax=Bacillus sp. JJ722 TaxID=3122973 RepID=UPI003000593B
MAYTNCYCDCDDCICSSYKSKKKMKYITLSEVEDKCECEEGASGSLFNPAPPSATTPIVAGTFPTNFPVQKVDFTTCGKYCATVPNPFNNSIKILQSGLYTISYAVTVAQVFSVETDTSHIIVGLYVNDVFDYSSGVTYRAKGTAEEVIIPSSLNVTYQRPLQAGDIVQVGFYEAVFSAPTASAQYGNASLIVKQDFNADFE